MTCGVNFIGKYFIEFELGDFGALRCCRLVLKAPTLKNRRGRQKRRRKLKLGRFHVDLVENVWDFFENFPSVTYPQVSSFIWQVDS